MGFVDKNSFKNFPLMTQTRIKHHRVSGLPARTDHRAIGKHASMCRSDKGIIPSSLCTDYGDKQPPPLTEMIPFLTNTWTSLRRFRSLRKTQKDGDYVWNPSEYTRTALYWLLQEMSTLGRAMKRMAPVKVELTGSVCAPITHQGKQVKELLQASLWIH